MANNNAQAPNAQAPQLFDQCLFTFVPGSRLRDELIAALSQDIINNGGQVLPLHRDGSIHLNKVTHIISNTIDFPDFTKASAMMTPVVKSDWVRISVLKGRPAQIRPFSPDPRMIFSDLVLSCADIPSSDKDAIIGATTAMGGVHSENVTRLTTHICALSMDHPKCQMAVDNPKKLNIKIVLPHWFDDCFRLGKRIDESPYLLPNPELLHAGPSDSVAMPLSQHMQGATSAIPDYIAPPKSVQGGRPKLTVFDKKKILLSQDLSIGARLRKVVEDLIHEGGGELTEDVEDCDMFICQYRDGEQYVSAASACKDVGNLIWLYHLITHNEWTSPLRRLLHYPIPRHGIPGFKEMKISVSNYGGEARMYLENLIIAAGATYTKTMKADNTHLISARQYSEKCEAAREWNIHLVNHLWLEESFAKCTVQSPTVVKYTHFPPRTNLGEVIGQTFLNEAQLRANYYPNPPVNATATAKRKRKMLDMAHDNEYPNGPAEGVAIGRQEPKNLHVRKDTNVTDGSFEMPAPAKRRATDPLATPAPAARRILSGKENETPSDISTGSRSAKAQALSRLSSLAPDIALYEKEKKRVNKNGHGPWGGKRAADLIDKETVSRRPSISSALDGEEIDEESASILFAKRPKPVEFKIILTGFKRWLNDKHEEDADRKKLRQLGIQVVQDDEACNFLVAPQILRTVKFIRNLSKGLPVISSKWIEECLDTGVMPPPANYPLEDTANEEKFGIKLSASIERAVKNKGKLLFSVPIYCSAQIKNGVESYRAIAETNGAIFKQYAARSGTTIKPTRPEDDDCPPEPVYLLSTALPEEKRLWGKFEDMARAGNMEPRVVASDWLLDVAMKQELIWDESYLACNFFKAA